LKSFILTIPSKKMEEQADIQPETYLLKLNEIMQLMKEIEKYSRPLPQIEFSK